MDSSTVRPALITGASSGIGYEIARLFAVDGHDLVLVSRSEDELWRIARDFQQRYGSSVTVIAIDLFRPEAALELYEEVKARGIVIDFLVNDAGQGVYGKFAETDLEKELAIVQLNVCSLVVLTKLFLREMLARNEGRILQLASLTSKNPTPYSAVYSGTKAFIYNFTQALISEIRGSNVTLTALRPGATDTDFFRKEGAERARIVARRKLDPPEKVAREGYEAMMRGEAAVVSGAKNKVMDALMNIAPDRMVAEQMRKMHEPVEESPE